MSVTPDVSRLSGWLNADAPCQVEREAWGKGRHAGREAWVRGRRKQRAGRSPAAHGKHPAHACDVERVETQRLIERRRGLPRGKGAHKEGRMPRGCLGSAWGDVGRK
jgi:hypothetical protein